MTQPTLADGPPVPLMVEGLLDRQTLARLFADLESAATVTGIREKGGPGEFAGSDGCPSATALHRLLSGTARAVQICYLFDGHQWTDTVFAVPHGFRVVRCLDGPDVGETPRRANQRDGADVDPQHGAAVLYGRVM